MKNFVNILEGKIKYYDSVAQKSKKEINSSMIEGRLRVSYKNGVPQYYHITNKGDTNGEYISKRDIGKIQKIAQNEYERRVYKCASKWSNAIRRFLHDIPGEDIKDIYSNSVGRRNVINPYELSDEEFLQQWLSKEYCGKEFDVDSPEIYSERGERVRSKSEKIIADKLHTLGIPYKYECPLYLKGFGNVYPDFTLLNIEKRREIVFEHFGMMDNPEYCIKAIDKINRYISNGFYPGDNFIMTYETLNQPLNTKNLTDMLNHFFS